MNKIIQGLTKFNEDTVVLSKTEKSSTDAAWPDLLIWSQMAEGLTLIF